MALKYPERTQETTTSTGTGDLVLLGAPDTSYNEFGDRLSNGDTTDVAIFGAGAFELCRATYNTGANSITRGTIYDSSSSGSRVTFGAGTKTVIVCAPGNKFGQLVSGAEAQSLTSGQKIQARSNIGLGSSKDARRNRLVNPTGQIWQEGVTTISDGTYDFDQWQGLTQTGSVTASLVSDVEDGTPFMMRLLQAQASAQRFGRIQWMENVNVRDLRGKPVALRARVRMSASTTLRYAIVEWTGTADTITKDIVLDWTNSTFTAGQFFTSTSTTVVATGSTALTANTLTDITELAGTVSSSMNNLAVFFWTDSTQAQNVTLDIANAGLYLDPDATGVAPPWELPDYGEELRRCQRYYQKSYPRSTAVGAATGAGAPQLELGGSNSGYKTLPLRLPCVMLASPTVIIYDDLGNANKVSNGAGNNQSGDVQNISDSGFCIRDTSTASSAWFRAQYAANARL